LLAVLHLIFEQLEIQLKSKIIIAMITALPENHENGKNIFCVPERELMTFASVVADPDITGFAENITNSLSGRINFLPLSLLSGSVVIVAYHNLMGNIHYPARLELEI
jgi:hypothetical protein